MKKQEERKLRQSKILIKACRDDLERVLKAVESFLKEVPEAFITIKFY